MCTPESNDLDWQLTGNLIWVFLLLQSEKACQISQHQLVVALRLKNPVLAAQCKVFVALSLIQRGQLKLASRIIRFVYSYKEQSVSSGYC